MTLEAFNALCALIRIRHGRARAAAHLVLIDGLRPSEAARTVGVSAQSATNAVTRIRKAHALARLAAV